MVEENQLVGTGSALPSTLLASFDQDLNGLAQKSGVGLPQDAFLETIQFLQPALLILGSHIVRHGAIGNGTRPSGIGGGVNLVKAQFGHQLQRTLILRFGLAGEADNYIGAERYAGDSVADAAHQLPIFVPGVGAAHPAKDFIVTGLHRQVDMLANLGQVGHRLNYPVVHIRGMRGQEADAFQTRQVVKSRQQNRQIRLIRQVITVSIHRLTQYGNRSDAPVNQQFHLARHLIHRAADLAPATVRDDAKGTHQIAAVDDRDVAGNIGMGRSQRADAAFPVQALSLSHQVQEGAKLLGLHEKVHIGEASSQLVGLGANHTTHQSQYPVRLLFLQGVHHPQVADDFILGALPDYAGVQDDYIGGIGIIHRAKAQLFQRRAQPLRVGLVHLAADSPDVKSVHQLTL